MNIAMNRYDDKGSENADKVGLSYRHEEEGPNSRMILAIFDSPFQVTHLKLPGLYHNVHVQAMKMSCKNVLVVVFGDRPLVPLATIIPFRVLEQV